MSPPSPLPSPQPPANPAATWVLACTECGMPIGPAQAQPPRTCSCGESFTKVNGIWRMLAASRVARFEQFLDDYTAIRHAEGRAGMSALEYRKLPAVEPDHALAWQWDFHQVTWQHVRRHHFAKSPTDTEGGLRVVDIGAGVGWLSHQLHQLGHHPVSIDLSVDPDDGLGATRHYPATWPVIQAEFDRLPISDNQADVVIFNASLHYSEDYRVTVREALRVLRPGGTLLVMETPVYRREWAGREMVSERHERFERDFGRRSDSIHSLEFLTDDQIAALSLALGGVRFRKSNVWRGWAWFWRPWKARLQRKRPPARFPVLTARKPD